jgi:replicative DNA helicase
VKAEDNRRAEAQIVSNMLRGPQFVTLALDKGFRAEMLSNSALRYVARAAIRHADVYADAPDYGTVERDLQGLEKGGKLDGQSVEAFLGVYEKVSSRAAKLNQGGARQAEFLSLLDHYLNVRRHEKMVDGMVEIVERSDGQFGRVRDDVMTLVAEMDDLADGRPPEGDLLSAKCVKEAALRHKRAKEDPDSIVGVLSGIEQWDATLHGFRRGEAWIIAGYVSEGKSMTCLQMAYSAAFEQGKNAVLVTTEMQMEQIQALVYSRHSLTVNKALCVANDGELGFEHDDLSRGRLEGETLELFKALVKDIGDGRATGRYGKIYVFGTVQSDTVQSIRVKCQMLRQQFPIDLIIIDYATLLSPRRPRGSKTEEMSEIMRDIKQLALNFNNGEGAAVVTAHQISRKGRDDAVKRGGYYILSDLADTSGAERNMDGVLWVLRDEDNKERSTAWLGCSKNRRGAVPERFEVRVNYAYAAFHAARYAQESDNTDDDFGG